MLGGFGRGFGEVVYGGGFGGLMYIYFWRIKEYFYLGIWFFLGVFYFIGFFFSSTLFT